MTEWMTLKEAARRLGVHEQTLRRWEKRGILRLVRLPGSGYRRVPESEVERLRGEMGLSSGPASTYGVRVERGEEARKLAEEMRRVLREGEPRPKIGYWIERHDPSPEAKERGHKLAEEIKRHFRENPPDKTLEELMSELRGRPWSS